MKKASRYDANGNRLNAGDMVRIIAAPVFSGAGAAALRKVFRYLIGKYRIVDGFDNLGNLEIWFRVPPGVKGIAKGRHWIAIEPELVVKKGGKRRTKPAPRRSKGAR